MRSLLVICLIASAVIALAAGPWLPLSGDGLHDPENPGIALLQQPEEALSVLPGDTAGNKVDWVRALRDNAISPRPSAAGGQLPEVLDSEVLMTNTSDTPYVLFPHKAHTEWMSCDVCHEELFKSEVGANDISMGHILEGEHCGRCHGAVAFPLTECNRCHSVFPDKIPAHLVDQLTPGNR